ncbi:hypothetical protein LC040_14010 [Bacillus tianshenii]|nr:hypothetical protein LC040_14010 [Bacillus tianshenii]
MHKKHPPYSRQFVSFMISRLGLIMHKYPIKSNKVEVSGKDGAKELVRERYVSKVSNFVVQFVLQS